MVGFLKSPKIRKLAAILASAPLSLLCLFLGINLIYGAMNHKDDMVTAIISGILVWAIAASYFMYRGNRWGSILMLPMMILHILGVAYFTVFAIAMSCDLAASKAIIDDCLTKSTLTYLPIGIIFGLLYLFIIMICVGSMIRSKTNV